MICKQRLLTPGPTPLYPKALYAMLGADVHHRTEDFRRIYRALLSDLKEVMGTRQDVLVLVCSGTGAMEASVTNCFSPGDRVIVCSAGRFGERWQEIARAYGLNVAMVEAPYGKAVAPEAVEKALAAYPGAKGVLVQAVESSTGVAHDVRSMGLAVKKTSALFIVDAITGLGTMPLSIDDWGLDIVIGGSQKSFMVPPGIAFLSISEKAWTAAIALLLAFAEALKYIKTLGMAQLVDNAQQLARAMRAACAALGLELFAAENPCAAVTAVKAPEGMDSGVIVREFRNRFGAVIANGPGALKGRIFRIAHLGYFDFPDLFAIVAELELILQARGFPVKPGAGVNAVQQVYSELANRKEEAVRA